MKKRNVVLLQPQVGDLDFFRSRPTPPLGLLSAATMVWQDLEVRLVDQRTAGNWRDVLAGALDSKTVAVGITALTGGMLRHALDAAREVRRLREVPIVWGGVHPSLLPEQTVRHELSDYVVEGEGELAFARLIQRLAAGAAGDDIPAVWFKRRGQVGGTRRATLLDFDALPPVPYALVDMENYIQSFRGKRMFFYQSSRGCPCRCAYCYNRVFNLGRWRARDAERVLEELQGLRQRYDFSLVFFLDDNFFIDRPRAMRIIGGLGKLGIASSLQGVDIETLARLSDQDLDFLEKAGLERIGIGVESGVDRVRAEILQKEGDLQLVRQQLARFQGRKILTHCSFLLGVPNEDYTEMRRTMDFALEILRLGKNFRFPQFFNYVPYPGTELFAQLERQDFQFPSRLEDWCDYEFDFAHAQKNHPRLREILERICFLSKFLDSKVDDFEFTGRTLRVLYELYRPVAGARLRHGVLWPLPERRFYQMLKWWAKRVRSPTGRSASR